jgi:serine/threonine protein kinase
MSPEGWQRVKGLFEAALEREGSERDLFIQQACEQDPTTGAELKRLLAEHAQAGSFLEEHAILVDSALADVPEQRLSSEIAGEQSAEASQGRRIGPYRTVREIGRGGMGTVYLAERVDGEYRKRVAIKLVNPHLGTEEILRRFRNERQVLAALDHPNIAGLLDGGTAEDGRPYLVMEYVEGVPIHAWCDSRKLGVRDRLRLFRKVCAAVQYAHDKEVIHRDIKPSNILVTTEGTPQLMDFGIAKVLSQELSAETLETTMGSGPMTPEYASPEQVRGERVGPASDIYSLGVVLYQLLTGQLPYAVQAHDLGQLERLICEQEPVKPSAAAALSSASELRGMSVTGLRRLLAGDLDKVVLKALRKEPERRYTSVAQFSDDIECFLQDLPVRARRESTPYRGFKFLKRNRVPALAAVLSAALVLAFVLGLGRFVPSPALLSSDALKNKNERWGHLKFERLATLGDPSPGGGMFTNDFEPWGLNDQGDLVFASDLSSTGAEGVYLLRKGAGLLALATPGRPSPEGGTFAAGVLGCACMNGSGDVAFVFGLKPWDSPELKGFNRAGLYRYSHADHQLNALVIPGVTVAPGFGVFQSVAQHASLNNSGDIVFSGVVRTTAGVTPSTGLGQGIFLIDRNAHIARIAVPGDPAPDGAVFDYARNPWINDRGDVAFGAHLAGEECISEAAAAVINIDTPGCMESIYLKRVGTAAVESIAHQGQTHVFGVRYRYAWGARLNNRGDVVYMGELKPGAGFRAARGIFLHTRETSRPIALPGEMMPDGRKLVTVNPGQIMSGYSLNNRGEVAFSALLENNESALYVHSKDGLHLIAGTGTRIPGLGTIGEWERSMAVVLNDSGQILFWAPLTDGRHVLLLATPSTPAGT